MQCDKYLYHVEKENGEWLATFPTYDFAAFFVNELKKVTGLQAYLSREGLKEA